MHLLRTWTRRLAHSQASSCSLGDTLRSLGRQGNLKDALGVFKEMRDNRDNVTPFHLSALLNAAIRSGNPDECKNIWKEVTMDCQVSPDNACYSLALNAAGQSKDKPTIDNLYNEWFKAFKPNQMGTWHFNNMIDAYSHIGDINKMMQIYYLMKDSNIPRDAFTMRSLLSGSVKSCVCFSCFVLLICAVVLLAKFLENSDFFGVLFFSLFC